MLALTGNSSRPIIRYRGSGASTREMCAAPAAPGSEGSYLGPSTNTGVSASNKNGDARLTEWSSPDRDSPGRSVPENTRAKAMNVSTAPASSSPKPGMAAAASLCCASCRDSSALPAAAADAFLRACCLRRSPATTASLDAPTPLRSIVAGEAPRGMPHQADSSTGRRDAGKPPPGLADAAAQEAPGVESLSAASPGRPPTAATAPAGPAAAAAGNAAAASGSEDIGTANIFETKTTHLQAGGVRDTVGMRGPV